MIRWDGTDRDVFLKILERVEKRQRIKVKVEDGTVKNISTFEDIRSILPPRNENTELTQHELVDILQVFMPSKEMREHLSKTPVSKHRVKSMILGAPVSLETKAEYCRRLSKKDDVFHSALDYCEASLFTHLESVQMLEWAINSSFSECAKNLQKALYELFLKPGEILYLKEAWFNEDTMENVVSDNSVPFLSFDAALQYLRYLMKEVREEPDTQWALLEKWVPGENGEMDHLYTYYLIGDEIIFYEKMHRDEFEHWRWTRESTGSSVFDSVNLDLPIPYHPGDIVKVGCFPFAPDKYVIILEEDNSCCECLYRREDGRWETAWLKHCHFFESNQPAFSPLYRISSCSGYLPRKEQLLKTVQTYIAGRAEKGYRLWDAFYRSGSVMGESDLMRLIEVEVKPDVLIQYATKHSISLSDVWSFWPYDAGDTEIRAQHTYDDELLFVLQNPSNQHRAMVVWDKGTGKAITVRHELSCQDVVRMNGKYYILRAFTRKSKPTRLTVFSWDIQWQYGERVYHEKLDPETSWEDAHFEADGDDLYIVLNEKRLACIDTTCTVMADE